MKIAANTTPNGVLQLFIWEDPSEPIHHPEVFCYGTDAGYLVHDDFGNLTQTNNCARCDFYESEFNGTDLDNSQRRPWAYTRPH